MRVVLRRFALFAASVVGTMAMLLAGGALLQTIGLFEVVVLVVTGGLFAAAAVLRRPTLLLFGVSTLLAAGTVGGVVLGPILPTPSVVMLVGLESTGADNVGPCYGYDRTTAPNLCGVAEDGVLFEHAYAQGSWTAVSVPSLLTARTPREVGIGWSLNTSFSDDLTTFPEVLEEDGYIIRTGGDTVLFEEKNLLRSTPESAGTDTVPSRPGPQFSFVFLTGTHTPYTPSDRFRLWDNLSMGQEAIERQDWAQGFVPSVPRQTLIDLYDAELREMDEEEVGSLVGTLKERGLYEDALLIFFADHGEAFGEHGTVAEHGSPPYEELVHVPLIIKFPGNRFAGMRVAEPVRLVDIPHTILDYVGIQKGFGSVGSSLLPVIGRAHSGLDRFDFRAREEETFPYPFAGMNPLNGWMVRRGNYTYLLWNVFEVCVEGEEPGGTAPEEGTLAASGLPEVRYAQDGTDNMPPLPEALYNLSADPLQQENIAENHTGLVRYMRAELCQVYAVGERNPDWFAEDSVSGELSERLRELGYLE